MILCSCPHMLLVCHGNKKIVSALWLFMPDEGALQGFVASLLYSAMYPESGLGNIFSEYTLQCFLLKQSIIVTLDDHIILFNS